MVLDLQLPDISGVEVIQGLAETLPGVRVLMLSASGEQQSVLDAVKAGATGYLIKSAAPQEFLEAVQRTAAGEAVFTPGLAGLVLGEYRRLAASPVGADDRDTPRLTDRETEVLRVVAKGLSYKQIAERLGVSHRTVQNHVEHPRQAAPPQPRGAHPGCDRAGAGRGLTLERCLATTIFAAAIAAAEKPDVSSAEEQRSAAWGLAGAWLGAQDAGTPAHSA